MGDGVRREGQHGRWGEERGTARDGVRRGKGQHGRWGEERGTAWKMG
jgi:hypothetical protein